LKRVPNVRKTLSMRILLVEDDPAISQFISKGMEESGYRVECASDGQTAISLVLNETFDLLILDLMLPKLGGLEILESARKAGQQLPILILSAKRSVDDRVKGLQAGSDDYLTKPFSISELLARVQALLRRRYPSSTQEFERIVIAGVSLDRITRQVERQGVHFDLQPKEFALLEFLMRNPGRVLSKSQILERVWNFQFDPETNVVDVLVHRLRTKIDKDFEKKLIHTIRGAGYVFQPN
jgi:DNA-binding response OmpR family regulator